MRNRTILAVIALSVLASCVAVAQVPEPLALPNRSVGGGALNQYTPGVEGGQGLNNIGLLIKTWGKVTYRDPGGAFFYIDDGSKLFDGSGYVGLRVACTNLAPGNTITPPLENRYVVVVGISSTTNIGGFIAPTLRPRRQADIIADLPLP